MFNAVHIAILMDIYIRINWEKTVINDMSTRIFNTHEYKQLGCFP
jgi:hypothetical protein